MTIWFSFIYGGPTRRYNDIINVGNNPVGIIKRTGKLNIEVAFAVAITSSETAINVNFVKIKAHQYINTLRLLFLYEVELL